MAMAAATIATGLPATQLLLVLCTAAATTGTATLAGVPGAGDTSGAAPPTAVETKAGDSGLLELQPLLFPRGGGLPHFPFPDGGQPHLPFQFNGGNLPMAGVECLNAVRQAEPCVRVLLRSLASPRPQPHGGEDDDDGAGRKACCGALQAVGDRCFRGVLGHVSLIRALYAPLVKHLCPGGGGLLPSPAGQSIAPGTRE